LYQHAVLVVLRDV